MIQDGFLGHQGKELIFLQEVQRLNRHLSTPFQRADLAKEFGIHSILFVPYPDGVWVAHRYPFYPFFFGLWVPFIKTANPKIEKVPSYQKMAAGLPRSFGDRFHQEVRDKRRLPPSKSPDGLFLI